MSPGNALLTQKQVIANWVAACRTSGGMTVIPAHEADQYKLLAAQKGVYRGQQNQQQGDKFCSQCTMQDSDSGTLIFKIVTDEPIAF